MRMILLAGLPMIDGTNFTAKISVINASSPSYLASIAKRAGVRIHLCQRLFCIDIGKRNCLMKRLPRPLNIL